MLQKVLGYGMVAVCLIATFAPEAWDHYALVLVAFGLIGGFMTPIEDVATRVAYYVLAAALPGIADQMDVIPAVGTYLNGFLDNFAVVIAGTAIANFCIVVFKGLTAAGDN